MKTEIHGINIDIVKRNVKNINIYVLPPDGRVKVSYPTCLTAETAAAFVKTKTDWIQKQICKFKTKAKYPEFVSGETLYVFGKKYILQIEHCGRKNSLTLNGDTATLNVRKGSTANQRGAYINEWYRSLLTGKIKEYLITWEKITGLQSSGFQTKNMTSRWGSCNIQTKKIWLNLQLAKKPAECLEYVILHELVHLKIPNHGRNFYNMMNQFMPDWKERRRLLNSVGLTDTSKEHINKEI